MNVGERVRELRKSKDMTPAELAKKSGLSTGHISEIENGNRVDLQTSTLKKLAKGLGVDIKELI